MSEHHVNQPKERPWLMRTYSGFASARLSNELYRTNLAKGQTGLSVAFDLPTQVGLDSDHVLARGEVGKLGVPVCSISDMLNLFDQIPVEKMNTSMTVNANALWILALYIAVAKRQNADISGLRGTTQNDIIKEYLSRGTYIFPPSQSLRLTADLIIYTVENMPKWNPINICSYHLQEAGANPVQEIAFTLSNAICVLDRVKDTGKVPADRFAQAVGRISFFLNAGIRFVEELCKIKAFAILWDRICKERYGVQDPKMRRFRYGVQVNSLALVSQQPENNIARIILEMLAVVLAKDSRAKSIQLPAWNEALGLPRKWDQQWSLRIQQIMAYETDILEYDDIFHGSKVIDSRTDDLIEASLMEIDRISEMGGTVSAIETGYMKNQLVGSNAKRINEIESGERVVVGMNRFVETEPSGLAHNLEASFLTVDESAEKEQLDSLLEFRDKRNREEVERSLDKLREVLVSEENIMDASIECAHAGVTTGEWAAALKDVFGEYRASTGVKKLVNPEITKRDKKGTISLVKRLNELLGRNLKILIAKPGLDGHSSGAEQLAIKARDVGMEVVYEGIRLTPDQIVQSALQEGVHVIGLSILSGSHLFFVTEILRKMYDVNLKKVPLIVGGIIPNQDEVELLRRGVAKVYTPKDYKLNDMMNDIVQIVARANEIAIP